MLGLKLNHVSKVGPGDITTTKQSITNHVYHIWDIMCKFIFAQMLLRLGPWVNIKMASYQYRKSHCGDKTVVRSSYLHNGISYTDKMPSLYWISPPGPNFNIKTIFPGMGIPMIKIRRLWDFHLYDGNSILVRCHPYTETAPRGLFENHKTIIIMVSIHLIINLTITSKKASSICRWHYASET